jgi:hypothetical protein
LFSQSRAPALAHGKVWPRMRGKTLTVSVLGMALGACSGSTFQGGVYRSADVAFRVGNLPPGYRPVDAGKGRLAFRDDETMTTILVNARCGHADDDVPLIALTNQLFMTFTERQPFEQRIEPMDGREALHTAMRAKLDGVAKTFDVYVLKKDGCVYDFVAIASPETADRTRPVFERFVAGFHTLATED